MKHVVVAAALILALAGCGDDSDPGKSGSDPSTDVDTSSGEGPSLLLSECPTEFGTTKEYSSDFAPPVMIEDAVYTSTSDGIKRGDEVVYDVENSSLSLLGEYDGDLLVKEVEMNDDNDIVDSRARRVTTDGEVVWTVEGNENANVDLETPWAVVSVDPDVYASAVDGKTVDFEKEDLLDAYLEYDGKDLLKIDGSESLSVFSTMEGDAAVITDAEGENPRAVPAQGAARVC